jgi:uncharacterized membrane protein
MDFNYLVVRPNWHVILIHYPLALLSLGLVIEIFSLFWRRGGFRRAGRWMILLGTLLAIPAITTGLYALANVVGGNDDMIWAQHRMHASLSGAQWSLLIHHMWWNIAGVGCFVAAVIVWLGGSDRFRRRLHWPLLLLAIAGGVCLICGAWHGGEMVYGRGLAVGMPTAALTTGGSRMERLRQAVPPLQLHLLLAGLTIAMAAAALGLSFRALAELRASRAKDEADMDNLPPFAPDERIIDALRGDAANQAEPASYPPARFWLLTVVLGLLTAAAGLWVMEIWNWEQLRRFWLDHHRELAHAAGGTSIIVLSLLLAAVTRWARRSGWLMGILSLLLVLAVAAQIWLGVLLAFDSMEGPVWRFNRPEPMARQSAMVEVSRR